MSPSGRLPIAAQQCDADGEVQVVYRRLDTRVSTREFAVAMGEQVVACQGRLIDGGLPAVPAEGAGAAYYRSC